MGFFESLGNAISAGASVVGNVVETIVEGVTDAAETVVETIDSGAEDVANFVTGAASNVSTALGLITGFAAGVVLGVIRGVANVVLDVVEVVRDLGGIVGAILSLDIARLLAELWNLVLHVTNLVVDIARLLLGGTIGGGVISVLERDKLRKFVKKLIEENFSGQRKDDLIEKIGLNWGTWGLPFGAKHFVFGMDSDTIDLRKMHFDGDIDLYAMAGLLSFNSFDVYRPRTYIKVMNKTGSTTLFPANRYNITSFLEETSDLKIQVIAMKSTGYTENMKTAVRAFKQIGVKLNWRELSPIGVRATENIHFLKDKSEYFLQIQRSPPPPSPFPPSVPDFDPTQGIFFANSGLKSALEGEDPIVAVSAFRFTDEGIGEVRGQVSGRNIDGPGTCPTPDRTDSCCSEVNRGTEKVPEGSGAIYRDVYPNFIYKYVLAHEIGHYFGLCHTNHDGIEDIMYTNAGGAGPFSGRSWRLYFNQEPTFSHSDGENAWRFIVDQLGDEI